MEKKFEELQLKDDFMFGIIMRNPKFCKPFLERILGVKISRIEYPKSQEMIDLNILEKGEDYQELKKSFAIREDCSIFRTYLRTSTGIETRIAAMIASENRQTLHDLPIFAQHLYTIYSL